MSAIPTEVDLSMSAKAIADALRARMVETPWHRFSAGEIRGEYWFASHGGESVAPACTDETVEAVP